MLKKLGLLLFVLVAAGAVAEAQDGADRSADEATIRQVTQDYIGRRDEGDEAGLRALLTENVDQRLTSGRMRTGQDEVVSGSLGSTQSSGGKRVITLKEIRFLGDDVAIANGDYNSLGRADGTDLYMRTTIIFQRSDEKWRIAAIRNARAPESE